MVNKKATVFVDEGYSVTVTGRHVLVTESMKDYALEKLGKLEKFHQRLIDVTVTMDIQKMDQRVDILAKINDQTIKSHAITQDMYASIDLAVERLEEQLRRYKDKRQNHHTKATHEVDMAVHVIRPHREDDVEDANLAIEEERMTDLVQRYRPHQVIAQKMKPLKTLTLAEAVHQMESSAHAFLLYRGEEEGKIRLIYRRDDGNYGIMSPE